MNIWLVFVPGSGATTVEKVIRHCSDLDCLPPRYREVMDLPEIWDIPDAQSSHWLIKQWHPASKDQLFAQKYKTAPVNIFTPIVPMIDYKGTEVMDYIKNNLCKKDDVLLYIGPSKDSIDFAQITQLKAPAELKESYPAPANDTQWEHREHLSLSLMEWWTKEMLDNILQASRLGFYHIDTMDIFTDLRGCIRTVIKLCKGSIRDQVLFDELCEDWSTNQTLIWDKWDRFSKYKTTIQGTEEHVVDLGGDLRLEAMIQHYIREQGTELLCYDLDNFPNSKDITKYYDI